MRTIKINHITKVEGHANLLVEIEGKKVKNVNLRITEGARMFESFLKGYYFYDIPLMVSRICGICSASHLISSINAIEHAIKKLDDGFAISEQTKVLRYLLSSAEILQSHVMHLYFMVLPDYLGFSSALDMAKHETYKQYLLDALSLKKLSQDIITLFGGREINGMTAVIGGFTKIPSIDEINSLIKEIEKSYNLINKIPLLFLSFEYNKIFYERKYLACFDNKKYAFHSEYFVDENFDKYNGDDYLNYIREFVKKGSSAKRSKFLDKLYLVGALARLKLNRDKIRLDDTKIKSLVDEKDILNKKKLNPFYNNIAQALEIKLIIDNILEILKNYEFENNTVDFNSVRDYLKLFENKESHGVALTEAPRGLLIHDYTFKNGKIVNVNIITPTAMNLLSCEEDIKTLVESYLYNRKEIKNLDIEKLIRAYDPCISCSTHFLKIEWKRS